MFVVEDKHRIYSNIKEFGIVPVITRFEFTKKLLKDTHPEITATFTRFLDPEFLQDIQWKNATKTLQESLKREVDRHIHFKSFSQLRVCTQGLQAEFSLVHRVVDEKHNDRYQVESTPLWSKFSPSKLDEVRDMMTNVFDMKLDEQ